ncbi:unnamed protein product [Nyctereutes procyonoides]|uniref:(raccoon dog) hypothetical protein n=1 Tax=Nyctereutes procyonoides TaxID=34880 RepID=A0A811YVF5_NYCPR|nr:unnamed protein product [Nyctereutes procyonoides]
MMPAAESKPRYMVVRPLNHCPDLEEPPAPLGALEAELDPPTGYRAHPYKVHGGQTSESLSDLEEPPAPLGALEAEQAPLPAMELMDILEQPPHSSKTRYMVVRPLNHCPALEEPPAPSSTTEEEHAQTRAIKVTEVPEQPPVSVQEQASDPE